MRLRFDTCRTGHLKWTSRESIEVPVPTDGIRRSNVGCMSHNDGAPGIMGNPVA